MNTNFKKIIFFLKEDSDDVIPEPAFPWLILVLFLKFWS